MPTKEEQDAEFEERVASVLEKRLNPAITSHLKRFESSFGKKLDESLSKFAAPRAGAAGGRAALSGDVVANQRILDAQRAARAGAARPGAPTRPGTTASSPEIARLREDQERLKATLETERRARTSAENKAREQDANVRLRSALEKKGISGTKLDLAMDHFTARRMVKFEDDGNGDKKPMLHVTRARAKGANPEELAYVLEQGVDDWAQTEYAKNFLPAPGTTQTRGQGGNGLSNGARRAPTVGGGKAPETFDEAVRKTTAEFAQSGIDIKGILGAE